MSLTTNCRRPKPSPQRTDDQPVCYQQLSNCICLIAIRKFCLDRSRLQGAYSFNFRPGRTIIFNQV
jgi:hypothetical protein